MSLITYISYQHLMNDLFFRLYQGHMLGWQLSQNPNEVGLLLEIGKSDIFVNNNCEVFNHAINIFRDMGIVSMFTAIHNTCMEGISKRKLKMEQKKTKFCTKPLEKLHKYQLPSIMSNYLLPIGQWKWLVLLDQFRMEAASTLLP